MSSFSRSPLRCKVVSFTRDMSLASGNQAVTGAGFTPRGAVFFAGTHGAANMGMGVDDGTVHGTVYDDAADGAGTYGVSTFGIGSINAAGKGYFGSVLSWDADGFTIAWTRSSTPTGTLTVKALLFE